MLGWVISLSTKLILYLMLGILLYSQVNCAILCWFAINLSNYLFKLEYVIVPLFLNVNRLVKDYSGT